MPIYDDHITIHNAQSGATTTTRRRALKSLARRGWVEVTADKVARVETPARNADRDTWAAYAKKLHLDVDHLGGRDAIRYAALEAERAAKLAGQPAGTKSPEGDATNPSKED